jgi:arginyl-tRNA synthetase
MGVEEKLRAEIVRVVEELASEGVLPIDPTDVPAFSVDRPKRAEHGDLATNVALVLQKLAEKPPRDVAALVQQKLASVPWIRKTDIAGPGFLNVTFAPSAFHEVLLEVHRQGSGYGRAPSATGERVLLEFVSANPTGPLLISHGRNAIVGDTIGRLLEATGNRVVREYYVNDFGNQVRLLARSVRAAWRKEPPPEGGYGGWYVATLAQWIGAHFPDVIDDEDRDEELARHCVSRMIEGVPGAPDVQGIRHTLESLNIWFDSWYSEESLHRWKRVDAVLARLRDQGIVVEIEGGALAFKVDEGAGDEVKDRIVRKSDGKTYTYFASDIAYHADKAGRGFDRLINVLGADHHGYVPRLRAALQAVQFDTNKFEVILYQLVSLLRDGQPYKMGKRLGNLITVDEVLEEIDSAMGRVGAGADALRYYYLSRRTETPLELDIEVAKKQNLDNPVFYLQYGHARLCAILRRARSTFGLRPPRPTPDLLRRIDHPDELAILLLLGSYPSLVAEAARERAPHKIVFFLQDLSQQFQSYFTRLKVERDAILPQSWMTAERGWEARWDRDKTLARLAWVDAIRIVYKAALDLLGIHAPERMQRPAAATDAQQPQEDEDDQDVPAGAASS